MHLLNESNIFLFLLQLAIILFLSRSLGEIFRKIKQPPLTAELLVGIILGPTILGRFFPELFNLLFPEDIIQKTMLDTVAWIGVLFLLLDTGLEINFNSAWKQRANAFIIAISDIVIPIVIAFIPSFLLPDYYLVNPAKKIEFSLFMAVVMTISAMPVASKVMHDLNLLKTDLGYLTMSALAVNDIVGWVLFTIILGLFTQDKANLSFIFIIFILVVGFSAIALIFIRRLSSKIIDFFKDNKFPEPSTSFTFACVLGIIFGAITQKLGIHALFGFFIAGVVVGEAKNLREETRNTISQMVHAFFVPIFFVNVGLKIDFIKNFDFFIVLLITIIGIFGRYIGAWIGIYLSKVPSINRRLISIAHTPGGMMEIVVAVIALENNLITQRVFIAIVFSAVISSILMGPWMSFELRNRKKINLSNFINFNYGVFFIEAKDKTGAIKNFLEKSKLIVKNLHIEEIYKEIIERETQFSTGLESGLAIPHIRTEMVKDPILLVGFSINGIDWNSIDGKPAHVIFFLLSPKDTNDLHIEILSKIVNLFKNCNFNEQINLINSEEKLKEKLKEIC